MSTGQPTPAAESSLYGNYLCSFESLNGGRPRVQPLRLYYEIPNDPISDDYTPDDVDAAELFERWRCTGITDREAEYLFGPGALRIHWYIEGPGVFERAPFPILFPREKAPHFLDRFTFPYDAATNPVTVVDWYDLPVVEKAWRSGLLPDGVVLKGGFIQEATGWKPRPLAPFVNVRNLDRALQDRDGVNL